MDQLNFDQKLERLLGEYLENAPDEDEIESLSIIDQKQGNYMFLEVGWQHPRRIYNVLFHLRLKDGKVWIEQDWTERGIAYSLLDIGIPKDSIEFAFQPPEMRPHIDWGELAV